MKCYPYCGKKNIFFVRCTKLLGIRFVKSTKMTMCKNCIINFMNNYYEADTYFSKITIVFTLDATYYMHIERLFYL